MLMLAPLPDEIRRIAYLGTPDIAVRPLEALHAAGFEIPVVVSRPDKRRSRRGEPEPAFDGIDVLGCGCTGHHQLTERLARTAALVLIEVFHEQHAIEMVEFVLEEPGEELIGLDVYLVSVEVVSLEVDLLRSHDLPG